MQETKVEINNDRDFQDHSFREGGWEKLNVRSITTPSSPTSTLEEAQYSLLLSSSVNDVIADKNAVTKIVNNSTGLQHIGFNGFAKRHWQTCYDPVAYGWCLGLC